MRNNVSKSITYKNVKHMRKHAPHKHAKQTCTKTKTGMSNNVKNTKCYDGTQTNAKQQKQVCNKT